MKFSRRAAMEILGAAGLAPAAEGPLAAAQVPAAPKEGKDTPKIALSMLDGGGLGVGGRGGAEASTPPDPLAGPRRIKQLGVDHVLGGVFGSPWTEASLNLYWNGIRRWTSRWAT